MYISTSYCRDLVQKLRVFRPRAVLRRVRPEFRVKLKFDEWNDSSLESLNFELDGSVGSILLGREHWVFSSIWALRIG